MPEDLLDRMPEDMPEHMPEDMPDRMPEDLPVRKCINLMVRITRSKAFFFAANACEFNIIYPYHGWVNAPVGRIQVFIEDGIECQENNFKTTSHR